MKVADTWLFELRNTASQELLYTLPRPWQRSISMDFCDVEYPKRRGVGTTRATLPSPGLQIVSKAPRSSNVASYAPHPTRLMAAIK